MKKCLVIIITIIYCFQILLCKESRILPCTYHELTRAYNLEIYLDQHDIYNLYEPINQNLQFSWTNSNLTISRLPKESYIQDQTLSVHNIRFTAKEYQKDITLNKDLKAIANFNFFYIDTYQKLRDDAGGFGFAFKFDDYKYSLVHQLKEQNIIDHLSYAIIPTKATKGHFYFGGIPSNLTKDTTVNSCKINTYYNTWGCHLTEVFFGNITNIEHTGDHDPMISYENTEYSYFQAGIRDIIAPVRFLHYITKSILRPYIESKRCIYENDSMEILCQISVIRSIPNFNFVFANKFALVFDRNNLFDCSGSFCTLLIQKNIDQMSNDWIFGTNFMKKYAMLFDYEDASITFYAKRDFVNLEGNSIDSRVKFSLKHKTIKSLYWTMIIALLLISVLLGWIKLIFLRNKK